MSRLSNGYTAVLVCLAGLLVTCVVPAANADDIPRYVDGNVLISSGDPSIAIEVAESFNYVGEHVITIADIGAGERFVFVDAADDRIRRLFIVQFEGFLPGVDDEFRYDLSNSPVVANYPFRSNGYAFDLVKSITANSAGEAAATNSFLTAAGFVIPQQWMMWRSLTVADKARRKEMIIFYVEDVASVSLTLSDLYQNDSATPAWVDIQKDLEARANNAFRITTLDESGLPASDNWSKIPNRFMH